MEEFGINLCYKLLLYDKKHKYSIYNLTNKKQEDWICG